MTMTLLLECVSFGLWGNFGEKLNLTLAKVLMESYFVTMSKNAFSSTRRNPASGSGSRFLPTVQEVMRSHLGWYLM